MSFLDETGRAQLKAIAEEIVKENFLKLFDFRVRPQGSKLVLSLAIDKKAGEISVGDCEIVSREMEKRLDEMELIQTPYLLEVSSPGMDRPLRDLSDCERFKGRLAQFILKEPWEGLVAFQGRLNGAREGKVDLLLGKERALCLPFETVKTAHLVVEL